MHKNWILILVLIGCFFIKLNAFAQTQSPITIAVNLSPPAIGGVCTLTINVKGTVNDKISWDDCDYLFKNSTKYFFLNVKSFPFEAGFFKHQILFTSLKAIKDTIKDLPITINGKKLGLPKFYVTFKADRIPAAINDIKPNEKASWEYFNKSFTYFLLILIGISIILIIIYYFVKKEITEKAPLVIKQKCLTRLTELEQAVKQDNANAVVLINQVLDLLNEYFQIGKFASKQRSNTAINIELAELFSKLNDTASQIKFLPLPAVRTLYPGFIKSSRELITNYTPNN
jgi:hypothetical protein